MFLKISVPKILLQINNVLNSDFTPHVGRTSSVGISLMTIFRELQAAPYDTSVKLSLII